MKGFQFIVSGAWGHFKKPETNNNPLSHDLITKTALIGMIGAVVGYERSDMKRIFPILSEDLLYGVCLLCPVKKTSWRFTSRKAINPTAGGSPKGFEILKNPSYLVSLALKDARSNQTFDDFKDSVRKGEAIYTPVLGWHNCPASLKWKSEGIFSEERKGLFLTKGFVLVEEHTIETVDRTFRLGFDRLPTHQNDDFWNNPEYYKNVVYPDCCYSIESKGKYHVYVPDELDYAERIEESWVLI
jgi:CRISPR-associated protein Cas5 subtype I-B